MLAKLAMMIKKTKTTMPISARATSLRALISPKAARSNGRCCIV